MEPHLVKMQDRIFEILTRSKNPFYAQIIKAINEKNYEKLKLDIKKENQDLDSPRDALINFLAYAIRKHDFNAVKILVDAGANVNYQNDNEYPIIDAIHLSSQEMLCFLFENGLNLNNKSGEAALMGTLCDDYLENAKLFFLHGAPYEEIDWDCEEIQPHIKEYFLSFIEKHNLENSLNEPQEKSSRKKV